MDHDQTDDEPRDEPYGGAESLTGGATAAAVGRDALADAPGGDALADAPGGDAPVAAAGRDVAAAEPAAGPAGPAGADAEAASDAERVDLLPEERRLTDLAARYPEIGPPLAALAFKIGEREWAERLVRMGLDQPAPGVEYYAVTANAARREGRHDDAFAATLAAVRRFAAMAPAPTDRDEGARLLQLVRQAFASLMFDLADVRAQPAFVAGLAELLPTLAPRLEADQLYHVLVAQVRWYDDAAASEAAWERATAADDAELAWNARGTWYKEAAHDVARAEAVYRDGLGRAPRSALLLHNLSQLLLEQAVRPDVDVEATRRLVHEAETLLRQGLRCEAPRGLRRHIHSTLERLDTVRASLPPAPGRSRDRDRDRDRHRDRPRGDGAPAPAAEPRPAAPPPAIGAVLTGRVASLTTFGAFVALGAHRGLLHKSELAHHPVADPATLVKLGDELEVKVIAVEDRGGQLRISLSRRALLPAPAAPARAVAAPGPAGTAAAPAEGSPAPRGAGQPDGRPRGDSGRPREARPRDARPRGDGGRPRDARPVDARSRGEGDRRRDDARPSADRDQRWPSDRATDTKLARLGEILLAKLKGKLPE